MIWHQTDLLHHLQQRVLALVTQQNSFNSKYFAKKLVNSLVLPL